MIIVFDTNVWKSELYLQSPSGAAVRFFLREQKARVGLPEVVRLEVEEHLRSHIKSVIDKLRTQHGRLLRLFGQLRELSIPAEDAIDAVIAKGRAARPGMFAAYAAWSAREIELQALATLAALAQISTPSAAHFLKSHRLLVQKFAADRNRQKAMVTSPRNRFDASISSRFTPGRDRCAVIRPLCPRSNSESIEPKVPVLPAIQQLV
jgi:predicted nucleic acid-binding protein